MLNKDQAQITERQLEALVAVYLGGYPWQRVAGAPEEPQVYTARAGGAVERMCESLRKRGYLTDNCHYRPDDPAKEDGNKLTVKGYDAIIQHVSGRLQPYIKPAELEARRKKREEFEAARDVRIAQHNARQRRKAEQRRAEHKRRTAAKAREILTETAEKLFRFDPNKGLELIADDDLLLDVADRLGR